MDIPWHLCLLVFAVNACSRGGIIGKPTERQQKRRKMGRGKSSSSQKKWSPVRLSNPAQTDPISYCAESIAAAKLYAIAHWEASSCIIPQSYPMVHSPTYEILNNHQWKKRACICRGMQSRNEFGHETWCGAGKSLGFFFFLQTSPIIQSYFRVSSLYVVISLFENYCFHDLSSSAGRVDKQNNSAISFYLRENFFTFSMRARHHYVS